MNVHKIYDVVKLINLVPDIPVAVGSTGTILIVHDADPPAYEVEFSDEKGAYLELYTVEEPNLKRQP
jgi:Domain of unknown function (DUF4926)